MFVNKRFHVCNLKIKRYYCTAKSFYVYHFYLKSDISVAFIFTFLWLQYENKRLSKIISTEKDLQKNLEKISVVIICKLEIVYTLKDIYIYYLFFLCVNIWINILRKVPQFQTWKNWHPRKVCFPRFAKIGRPMKTFAVKIVLLPLLFQFLGKSKTQRLFHPRTMKIWVFEIIFNIVKECFSQKIKIILKSIYLPLENLK